MQHKSQHQPCLRQILTNYLQYNNEIQYPQLEATILQFNPLQITDDFQTYLDISSLQEEITDQMEIDPATPYKLILNNWRFVFKKIPNSHDYYFDIVSGSYSIVEDEGYANIEDFPMKMVDIPEIRYYFEERKRQEYENILRHNMRVKTTPFKTPTTKAAFSPSLYSKPTPGEQVVYSRMTPIRTLPATPSMVYPQYEEPQIYNYIGVKRSVPFEDKFSGLYLTVYEVLSAHRQLILNAGNMKVTRKAPHVLRPIEFTEEDQKQLIALRKMLKQQDCEDNLQLVHDQEEELLQSELIPAEAFKEIQDGINDGVLDWGDLEFSRECLNYIQRNIHLLDG